MLLVDDYTRMSAVFFLKNKSEAFENFKIYKEMVENEMCYHPISYIINW
jgi:hypothetical protein